MLQAALRQHRDGKLRQAEKKYRQVLVAQPGHFDATHMLGVVAFQKGEIDTSIDFFRKAISIRDDVDEVFFNLGMALAAGEFTDAALQAFEHAMDLNPENAKAPFNAAVMLHEHGRPEAAVEMYGKAVAIDPGYTKALINLGIVLKELGRLDEAEASSRRAVDSRPDNAEPHCNLGVLLHDRGKLEEALVAFQVAIDLQPDFALALMYKGHLLHDMERLDEAIAAFRASLSLDPTLPGARINLGDALRENGDLQQAEEAYRQSIERDADNGEAYRCLADLKKFSVGDPEVKIMEKLLEKAEKQGGTVMDLHYALAKAYQDTGDAEASFVNLAKANAIKRSTLRYDVADDERLFERIAGIFDKHRISDMAGSGCVGSEPIFIIGMPRSGTTLVEQILASHSRVDAGGEMMALSRTVAERAENAVSESPFPQFIEGLKPADLTDMGRTYLARAGMTGDRRKTDKMPANFIYSGLIRLILPKARIIHCVRDPVDTCLSCLQRLFAKGQRFSYDQVELGRYYLAYDRLMRHWHDVLGENVYRVRYEELVADQEGETRKLLEKCGLPWEQACLNFHQTDRVVRTASAVQVRQPIYDSSIRRWQPYRHQLSDLLAALGPVIN